MLRYLEEANAAAMAVPASAAAGAATEPTTSYDDMIIGGDGADGSSVLPV